MTARLSTWLAMRCREPQFQAFLNVHGEEDAVSHVRALCHVGSRAELDTNPKAAERCHELIRRPYAEYMQSNQEKELCHDH